MRFILVVFLILCLFTLQSQKDSAFHLNSLIEKNPSQMKVPGLSFSCDWKFKKGHNPEWCKPELIDTNWAYIKTELNANSKEAKLFEHGGWFRLHLKVDSNLLNKPLVLMISHLGASEIYLDGKELRKFGKIDNAKMHLDEIYNPLYFPIYIEFSDSSHHLIAVRYRDKEAQNKFYQRIIPQIGFDLRISEPDKALDHFLNWSFFYKAIMFFYFAFFLALGILHFLLFIYYKRNISNLYYSIFAISFGCVFIIQAIVQITNQPDTLRFVLHLSPYIALTYGITLIAMLYTIFYKRILKLFWLWVIIMVSYIFTWELEINAGWLGTIFTSIIVIEPIRVIISAIIKKKDGAWIIGIGVITSILFFTSMAIMVLTGYGDFVFNSTGIKGAIVGFVVLFATISIPLSMSAFLAREFGRTHINLENKLLEVESLSAKTIAQEKEKQHILENQNITLEEQVKIRTHEVVEQKKVIEEKNKDIVDSITYAKRIQDATLPSKDLKQKLFPNAFILFKPKDVVSGDFYWYIELNGTRFIAAADCTGHGVPGALVSIVCSNALNRAVKEFRIVDPGKILDKVRELVLESFSSSHFNLEQSQKEIVRDGMDISLAAILAKESESLIHIKWAGANNPFWYIHKNELKEIKGNKQPIGHADNLLPFTTHELTLTNGDNFYLFTDGFADQFGGPKGKKYKYKQFEELILSHKDLPMLQQEKAFLQKFDEWKGNLSQVDDVLVIGVQL